MKRTMLKRKKALNPISAKRAETIRQETILRLALLERCKGLCMECRKRPDFRGLPLSHTKPKGMGGTARKYSIDEVKLLCGKCHAKLHNIKEV